MLRLVSISRRTFESTSQLSQRPQMIFEKHVLDAQPRETENRMQTPKNIMTPNDLRNEGDPYRETMIMPERTVPNTRQGC